MKRGVLLIFGLFILLFIGFIIAEEFIDSEDPFIKEKMILDLPELSGFTYGGTWDFPPNFPYYHIDLRYYSPQDSDQHSEYLLEIFDSNEEAEVHFNNEVNRARTIWDISLKDVNGNKVFEGISRSSIGDERYFIWLSGNNVLQGWNGNDLGTVIDNALFEVLADAYLEKYPSTYEGLLLVYTSAISEEKLESLSEAGIGFSMTPLWSAKLQTPQDGPISISLVNVIQNRGTETIWEGNWYYLYADSNEYIADTSITYVNRPASTGTCSVNAPDESCGISKILLNFDPGTEYSSSTFAYDGFIADISTRELVENLVPQFELNFDPETGTLSSVLYNGESIELIKEAGFVSYGKFNTLYGSAE